MDTAGLLKRRHSVFEFLMGFCLAFMQGFRPLLPFLVAFLVVRLESRLWSQHFLSPPKNSRQKGSVNRSRLKMCSITQHFQAVTIRNEQPPRLRQFLKEDYVFLSDHKPVITELGDLFGLSWISQLTQPITTMYLNLKSIKG